MDGFSGAAAVISLTIQLASTVQSVRQFLRNVENAPKELASVMEQLDLLYQILSYLKDLLQRQAEHEHPPTPYTILTSALQNCEQRMRMVEEQAKPLTARVVRMPWLQKALGSVKFVLKKEDIQTSQALVGGAIQVLQVALSTNQLQYAHIMVTGFQQLLMLHRQAPDDFVDEEPRHPCKSIDDESNPACQRTISVSRKSVCHSFYRGVLGNANIQRRRKFVRSLADSYHGDGKLAVDQKAFTLMPSFLRYSLEIVFVTASSWIPRALNVYHTVRRDAPIFWYVRIGDLNALQLEMQRGDASPFMADDHGQTLLHRAAVHCHVEMCAFLIDVGVDADRVNDVGRTAIETMGYSTDDLDGGWKTRASEAVDTLRILTKCQDHILIGLAEGYRGPPEGADLMLSLDLIEIDGSDEPSYQRVWPLLTIALNRNADNPDWECFIRKLLRMRVNIHAPAQLPVSPRPSPGRPSDFPSMVSDLGTPLDQLMDQTDSPFEGHIEAQRWFSILESEGYDVRSYLEEEKALHASQGYLLSSAYTRTPEPYRQLTFELEKEPPVVSWDWWTHPDSPAFLVLEEFKWMNGSYQNESWIDGAPTTYWPFDGSNESDFHGYMDEDARQRERVRTERRMRKQDKKQGKANGHRNQFRIPGAWLE